MAEVLGRVVAQVQRHAGAAGRAVDGFHLEITGAGADPAHAFGSRQTGATAFNGNFVCHDEAAVKAHAELTDELSVFLLVAAHAAHEFFGAALGNGAEVVNGFLSTQTNAVVGDGEGFGFFVERQAHIEVGRVFEQRGVVQAFETQFVAGIRCVGHQLAQENFLV